MTMSKRPLRDVVQLLAQALDRFHQVAGQHQDARAREQFGRLLLQPLDAGADRRKGIHRLAFRALVRQRHGEAAVMADEPPPEAVIHQPGVAVRAGQAEAAAAAERERRKAAAVEEQERLLAALDGGRHRFGQPRRDEAAARRAFAPEIDSLDAGQALAAETLRQMQAPVAAALRIHLGFDRRRRRRQHDRDAGDAGAHHRHVAGVIAHAVLLLVGGIVLLIHDNEPEIGVGQEQRRAGADGDARLARRHRRPGAPAQPLRQLRVPFGGAHAEALGETVEHLRGERDLRHQDQRLPAARGSLPPPLRDRPRSCRSR